MCSSVKCNMISKNTFRFALFVKKSIAQNFDRLISLIYLPQNTQVLKIFHAL